MGVLAWQGRELADTETEVKSGVICGYPQRILCKCGYRVVLQRKKIKAKKKGMNVRHNIITAPPQGIVQGWGGWGEHPPPIFAVWNPKKTGFTLI